MLNFFIRVDASILIGTGHVLRCLTLADGLKNAGHRVSFICRAYPGHLIHFIEQKGFDVYALTFADEQAYTQQVFSNDYSKWLWVNLNQDAIETIANIEGKNIDFLIVDHYALDTLWEKALRPYVKKIMVIDDLANRQHDCDVLLDQNFYLDLEHRYDDLVPKICKNLLGPQYVLIRPAFLEVREKRKALGKFESHPIKNILIYMGGADPKNVTAQVIKVLIKLPTVTAYHIDVVVGASNPHKGLVKELCKKHHFVYHCQPPGYLDLLIKADLAIAAGGVSTYERCEILLPSIVRVLAENQKKLVTDVGVFGAHYVLDEMTLKNILQGIQQIETCFVRQLNQMASLIDGKGVERICTLLESTIL